MKKIRVLWTYYQDRQKWVLYYRDPVTRLLKTKTTDVSAKDADSKRAVRDEAEKWEKELNESRSNISWEKFRERYENEVLSGLAENSDQKACTVMNSVEAIIAPKFLRDVTADAISRYQARLREKGIKGRPLSEHTIASNLSGIRAFLNWAVQVGLLASAPTIRFPSRAKTGRAMKGRPITQEEFERMLKVVPKVVGKNPAQSWTYFLEGLWLSGLRLAESLQLYWDDDRKLRPILAGKESFLRIPAALEKGNTDRTLPMAPEFAEFLAKSPEAKRRGPIFRPLGEQGNRVGFDRAGHIITAIGKKAGVVVSRGPAKDQIKYASAHDLRRSFGTRWSKRVMPAVLQQLMRHRDINTTMRYYVEDEARSTARTLWDAYQRTVEPDHHQQTIQQRRKSTTPKTTPKPKRNHQSQ